MAGWLSITDFESRLAVVVPVDDVVGHDDEAEDCVCGPELSLLDAGDDGGDFWMITHQALDGRA